VLIECLASIGDVQNHLRDIQTLGGALNTISFSNPFGAPTLYRDEEEEEEDEDYDEEASEPKPKEVQKPVAEADNLKIVKVFSGDGKVLPKHCSVLEVPSYFPCTLTSQAMITQQLKTTTNEDLNASGELGRDLFQKTYTLSYSLEDVSHISVVI
jgi:hypothetical protein